MAVYCSQFDISFANYAEPCRTRKITTFFVGIVVAIDDIKSISQVVKMLIIDSITLISPDVYEITNHGSCVGLGRKNLRKLKSVQF